MATVDEYAEWIVKNADKRGTPEFDTVAQAYDLARSDESKAAGNRLPSDELKYGAGLAARAGVNMAAGFPAFMADAITGLPRNIANRFLPADKQWQSSSQALNDLMTKAGVSAPRDRTERVLSDVLSAVGGTGGVAKVASKAGEVFAPLAINAGKQMFTAGSGSLAGSVARESGGSPLVQFIASLLGSTVPGGVHALQRGIAPNLTQSGRDNTKGMLLNKSVNGQREEVLDALDQARPFVAGERPTAAQAASVANVPAFAAMEKLAGSANPNTVNMVAARNAENAAARIGAVRSIGQDKAALMAAEKAREAVSAPLYRQAEEGVMPLTSNFNSLMQRDQFKSAVKRAEELARNKGLSDIFFRDSDGKPVALIGNGVHFIKKALDEAGEFGSKSYTGKQDAGSAIKTRDLFLDIVNKSIPEYGQAKAAYAGASPPVNQMQIGQFLEQKLTTPLQETERPAMFAQAMRDAPGTIKKSVTDAPRFKNLDDPGLMTKEQVGLLGSVEKSLAREANTRAQATEGTRAAGRLLGAELSPVDIPNWLSKAMTLARYALEHVGVKTMNKTIEELAKDMRDPAIAAKLMREATPTQLAAMKKILALDTREAGMGLLQSAGQIKEQP